MKLDTAYLILAVGCVLTMLVVVAVVSQPVSL